MNTKPPEQLDRLAQVMQWFCLTALAVVALAAAFAGIQLLGDPALATSYFPNAGLYAERITGTQIGLSLAVNLLTILLVCRGLYALWAMFGAFRIGDLISTHTSSLMRQAGGAFLSAAIWSMIANTLTILILTANNPAGERQLAIGLSSNQLFPVLLAGVLFAIGHVMKVATEIEAENREFI